MTQAFDIHFEHIWAFLSRALTAVALICSLLTVYFHCVLFNVAHAITADYFKREVSLEGLCTSSGLNLQQLEDLLESASAQGFDITLHRYMLMFHMEHCVFCAFLPEGTDFTNCGRLGENMRWGCAIAQARTS